MPLGFGAVCYIAKDKWGEWKCKSFYVVEKVLSIKRSIKISLLFMELIC